MRRPAKLAAAGAAVLMLTAGCGGIYDMPLPGGAALGDHPYTVKVRFSDVLDLVPQAGVKVNEVPVGRVEHVGLAPDGWTAEVTVVVNGDVVLPSNALANVRQSSLLGEKYVDLAAPRDVASQARLADGAIIPVERTNRSVEVEEVFGALSMLLNGGGVEQLNTITRELNNATEGRAPDIKALLDNSNKLVTALDSQTSDITRALDGLNRLTSELNSQRDKIAGALEDLGPGLAVLEQQRGQLVTMLQALQNLSGVATDTVNKSKENLVADLKALLPTLQKLGQAGSDLPKALELLLSFPFADSAVDAVKGDYFNLFLTIDLNLDEIIKNLGRSRQNPLSGLPILGDPLNQQTGVQPGAPPPLPLPSAQPQAALPGGGGPPSPARTGGGAGGIFSVLSGGAG